MEPVLVVLLWSGIAALTSMFGVVPLLGRPHVPLVWLGWSNAAAAGTMMAAAFLLAQAGLAGAPQIFGIGAALGILFVWWTHRLSRGGDLDLNDLEATDPVYGYEVLLSSNLHSGVEGVAIGAAMAYDVAFGVAVAVAMALHNIPEATLLTAVFRARGLSPGRSLLLAVVSNISQVTMALSTFAVLGALGIDKLAFTLAFASGGLLYLLMVDLLPQSYEQAGSTSIALVTIVAMALVAVMQGMMP